MKKLLLISVAALLSAAVIAQQQLLFSGLSTLPSQAVSARWSPTNIAGMAYWWSYQDFTDGQVPTSWTDRVSGVVFSSQDTAPTNSVLYGLRFANTWLTNATGITIASNLTFWCVLFKSGAVGDTVESLISFGDITDGFWWRNSAPDFRLWKYDNGNQRSVLVDLDTTLGLSSSVVWANGLYYTNGVSTTSNMNTAPFANALKSMGKASTASRKLGKTIQQFGIWTNTTLTAGNVASLYDYANTNTATNITSGLLAWWRLDENTGTTTVDSSGNGWSGTLLSTIGAVPTWTNGQINAGLKFGGGYFSEGTGSNYVLINSSTALADNLPEITISLWYRLPSATNASDPKVVLSKIGAEGVTSDNRFPGWEVHYDDNSLSTYFVQSNSVTSSALYGGYCTGFNDTNWHHYVSVKDSTGTNLLQYMDGILQTFAYTIRESVTNYASPTNNVMMGWNYDPASVPSVKFFPGFLDEVRIYNRTLSAIEVQSLYRWGMWQKGY